MFVTTTKRLELCIKSQPSNQACKQTTHLPDQATQPQEVEHDNQGQKDILYKGDGSHGHE
ncbi:MAG: hypothetical protein Kow0063_26050 [Anaerolineae bacterium]